MDAHCRACGHADQLVVALAADRSPIEAMIRGAFFLPMVISGTVIGIIWLFVYTPNPDIGLLNALTGATQSWLGDLTRSTLRWWRPGFGADWHVGGNHRTLKGVPADSIDAAKVDGANGWQVFGMSHCLRFASRCRFC